eukprot:TRINITY_DN9887_c0_g1_i1.p1 TRINITY_DN9887_c0_g1~~TRINITY_DN9887_c0_g1_i1.p1  ORF type:complete len:318 (+),score=50.01 TRINITY_DN9887_c0_g1_i1:53-1006(+)
MASVSVPVQVSCEGVSCLNLQLHPNGALPVLTCNLQVSIPIYSLVASLVNFQKAHEASVAVATAKRGGAATVPPPGEPAGPGRTAAPGSHAAAQADKQVAKLPPKAAVKAKEPGIAPPLSGADLQDLASLMVPPSRTQDEDPGPNVPLSVGPKVIDANTTPATKKMVSGLSTASASFKPTRAPPGLEASGHSKETSRGRSSATELWLGTSETPSTLAEGADGSSGEGAHALVQSKDIKRRLQKKAVIDEAEADASGRTPVLCAATPGHDQALDLLLDAKADADKATQEGVTPIFMAAQAGDQKPKSSSPKLETWRGT